MKKSLLVAAFGTAVSLMLPGMALADTLSCVVKQNRKGYFPKEYVIDWPTGATEVQVKDPATLYFNDGKPATAKVRVGSSRTSLNWSISMRNSSGQQARMVYSLRYNNANGKGTLSAKPMGYIDNLSSRVTCVRS